MRAVSLRVSHEPGRVWHGDTGDIACDSYHRTGEDLEDKGGWAARDTAEIFADFAAIAGRSLGDLVDRWITINEPYIVANLGYRNGIHAPGITDPVQAAAATHHLLLAHGLAVTALRGACPGVPEVGITLNLAPMYPATPEADLAARVRDAEQNGVFLDPLLRGAYPSLLPADRTPADVRDGDFDVIRTPTDFLGINYYLPHFVGTDGLNVSPDGMPVTAMGWRVHPDGLYDLLIRVRDEAPRLPLYITENGAAYHDYVSPDGTVDDYERIDYLDGHLRAAARAIADGADLRGYFAWSLMDNFEWAMGYSRRFGLVFTDFGTQRRIIKRSGHWYADVIKRGGLS